MIPLRDTIRSSTAPVVTVALIAVNVLVFLHEQALGPLLERFVFAYGLVPARFVHWGGDPFAAARFLPLLTSMFWHGGWLHLLGNMLYLWIFGDNIEDKLGHGRYLVFYLLGGLGAALLQIALAPESRLPTIGASGAIAAVLGAYLVSFPRSKVLTFIPIFFVPWFVEIPAVLYLATWFGLQILSGWMSQNSFQAGGTAWWAHVGGFIAGVVLVKVMAKRPATGARNQPGYPTILP